MREPFVRAVLIAAIGGLGLGAVPVVSGLAPERERGEYVPIAEYYWLNKFKYERHVGRSACDRATGLYRGTIRRVSYEVWVDRFVERERRWVYTIRAPHPYPVVIRRNRSSGLVVSDTIARATDWQATTGRCPDGRPK